MGGVRGFRAILITLLAAACLGASVAMAAMHINRSVSFSGGLTTSTSGTRTTLAKLAGSGTTNPCAGSNVSLAACGTFVGATSADGAVTLRASGTAVTICTNQGGTAAPGQNPKVTVTGSQPIAAGFVKNGTFSFSTLTQPPSLTWQQAGCANSNWSAQVTGIVFSNANISVVQNGVQTFNQNYVRCPSGWKETKGLSSPC